MPTRTKTPAQTVPDFALANHGPLFLLRSLTVASDAPQDWHVTMDEFVASLGVTNAVLPQFAQVSMLGGAIRWSEVSRKKQHVSL
jgi:hypothetical protein